MTLDRNLQRKILTELANYYPSGYPEELQFIDPDTDLVIKNVFYLAELGLLEHGLQGTLSDGYVQIIGATRITARGLDFLADDGGLSAILGVVTIKIHDDTLKTLIENKIVQSDLPQPDKKRWIDQLRELPAETTKHLALKLVDLGLANTPTALAAIGSALGLGAGG
ncbi:hypothetical protein [Paracandidimonas lactea]|uniref:hypothetical protein n=1 Tax=Paracandidimonas lactea TaxID=2895524 RepID=UPI001F314399|nr:hypothetical protein [Paracandidimonas lactea]